MNDLISRLSEIRSNYNCFDEKEEPYYRALSEAIQLVSAQPERKRGEWIDAWRSAFDGTRHWHRECSECGYERDDDSMDKDTRFCSGCGADMRKDEGDG